MPLHPLIALALCVPLSAPAAAQHPGPKVGFRVAAQQAGEGAGQARIEIDIDTEQTLDVIVPFSLSGTALTPDDYTILPPASSGQVVLPAGQATAVLAVMLVDDTLFEAAENLVVTLGTPTNAGLGTIVAHTLTILDNDPAPVVDFALAGAAHDEGAGSVLVTVQLAPQSHSFNDVHLRFTGDFEGSFEVDIHGSSGVGGQPYLHPVICVASTSVDYDLSGGEDVFLDGSDSHTHESGHVLTAWEWRENATMFSGLEQDTVPFPVGPHTVELTIHDDNTPPQSLATSETFEVVPVNAVPGVLALYYFANPPTTMARELLDNVPANPDFAELSSNLRVATNNGVGGSGRRGDVMVRLDARFDVAVADTYDFYVSGGAEHRIDLDAVPFSGPIALAAGTHDLEVRWAVDSTAELPLDVLVRIGGGAFAALDPGQLTHDQRTTPVINSMPAQGITQGGNEIVISGFAFFPRNQVKVHWGGTILTEADFTAWSAESIEFPSPAGSAGFITVSVETPYGTSNPRTFEYTFSGPIPVLFAEGPKPGVTQPTALAWGPDGRLWVASRKGTVHAFEFNDDYTLKGVENFSGVSSLTNREIMGLAFNPYDAPSPVKVYVVHSETYAQGGGAFVGSSPYPGQVSVLTEPDFDSPTPLIDGLPTSNHDHGTNGAVFDNNGDLLICLGGNTNAGVIWPTIGNLPESPLSGSIIKARTSRPGFNGSIRYLESETQTLNGDQGFGDVVEVAPGVDVSVQAAGLRNSFDLAYTTWGMLYATDNGPNTTWGPASTGPNSQTSYDPYDSDELLLVEYDHYYGHPNRNRGRFDPIQNVYMDSLAPAQPGFTQALAPLPSSTNGITEYRAETFGGAMRGELLALKLNGQATRIRLSADKRTVLSSTTLATMLKGLDLAGAPGGALVSTDYNGGKIRTFIPVDAGVNGPTVYDIFPWRAPAGGGVPCVPFVPFVIGGENFGSLTDTTVSIDGSDCLLSSVSPKRIRGVLPVFAQASNGLVDVTVTVAGVPKSLTKAFQVLPSGVGKWQGAWEQAPPMPVPIGEVAAGAIAGKLYVIGEFSGKTVAFDTLTRTWSDSIAKRPFQGHHHAAEVYQGKLYVIGGLNGGSPGQVQIFDPLTDSWSLGSPMPWSAGSVSTALIGGKIYAAGGIVGNTTVDDCAEYDVAADTWTPKTPMPAGQGRNHAAAASDGQRMFIFGGRGLGSGAANVVADGFPDVQIYEAATDTWTTSLDPGSTLAPMPIGRGGTGKAVFCRGEFHVFGGETLTGPGAQPGNVYDRVDVYDPLTNTWRLEKPMPTPRHGICPVFMRGKIYVAGGGTNAGSSSSAVLEIYSRQ
jgi:N-acetylneuraminic acid mutarotase/glucose/arabinose dehydrogenase